MNKDPILDFKEFLRYIDSLSSEKRYVNFTLNKIFYLFSVESSVNDILSIFQTEMEPECSQRELFLLIFKYIMNDPVLFMQFWNNFNDEANPSTSFAKDLMRSFPFDIFSFLKLIKRMSGTKMFNFSYEIIEILSELTYISSEFKSFEHSRMSDYDEEDIEYYQTEQEVLIQCKIRIPPKTLFYFSDARVVCFKGEWNFWKILWNNISSVINDCVMERVTDFPIAELQMIKFLCEIIQLNPNLILEIENKIFDFNESDDDNESNNGMQLELQKYEILKLNSESSSKNSLLILFLVECLDVFFSFDDNEKTMNLILETIKCLLRSSFKYETEQILHFYGCISIMKSNETHPLVKVFYLFQEHQKNIEKWHEKEKNCFKMLYNLIEIICSLFGNDSVIMSQMKEPFDESNYELYKMSSTSNKDFLVIFNQLVNDLAEKYEKILNNEYWVEQNGFCDLMKYFNLKDFSNQTGFLENLIESVIFPINHLIQNNKLNIISLNSSLKYDILTSFNRVCETFIKKMVFNTNNKELQFCSNNNYYQLDKLENKFENKIQLILNQLNISGLLIECFECSVNKDIFNSSLVSSQITDKKYYLENKHWVNNVIQFKNEKCRNNIREYLLSGLSLLSSSIELLSKQRDNNIIPDVYKIIGERDHIYKYSFFYLNKNQSVNLFVCITSLLLFDKQKNFNNALFNIPEMISQLKMDVFVEIFSQKHNPNQLLSSIPIDIIFNKTFDSNVNFSFNEILKKKIENNLKISSESENEFSIEKLISKNEFYLEKLSTSLLSQSLDKRTVSVQNSVLKVLCQMNLLWNNSSKLKKPNLFTLIGGIGNDLPESMKMFKK